MLRYLQVTNENAPRQNLWAARALIRDTESVGLIGSPFLIKDRKNRHRSLVYLSVSLHRAFVLSYAIHF